jgi:protein-S-isoprenylcysteine O-methyltransferase Ste14
MYIGLALNLVGGLLIITGWRSVHRSYWSKHEGEGMLVTDGIYAYTRHPQYTGFIIMTLGLLIHWATIPLLAMWPLLVLQYYRLARKEEVDMEDEFGDEYREYKEKVPMFIPFTRVPLAYGPYKEAETKIG